MFALTALVSGVDSAMCSFPRGVMRVSLSLALASTRGASQLHKCNPVSRLASHRRLERCYSLNGEWHPVKVTYLFQPAFPKPVDLAF
jgi:hypothetical protein